MRELAISFRGTVRIMVPDEEAEKILQDCLNNCLVAERLAKEEMQKDTDYRWDMDYIWLEE